jgi:heme/copper-type cytochrome/quinol oxidase subunit 2
LAWSNLHKLTWLLIGGWLATIAIMLAGYAPADGPDHSRLAEATLSALTWVSVVCMVGLWVIILFVVFRRIRRKYRRVTELQPARPSDPRRSIASR